MAAIEVGRAKRLWKGMKNKTIRKHNIGNKGMSLVEVIVAVALLTIVIIPVLQSFVYSARFNAKSSTLQKATVAAQTIMENYKAYPVEDICQQFSSGGFMVGSDAGVSYRETEHNSPDVAGNIVHKYLINDISYENSVYDAEIVLKSRTLTSVNAYQDSDPYCDAVYMVETDNAHNIYDTIVNEAQARWSALSKADTEPDDYDVKQLNFDRRVEVYVNETPEGKITVKVKEVYSFQTYFRYVDDTGVMHGGLGENPVEFWGYAMPDASDPDGPFILRYNPDWATEISPPPVTIYDNSLTVAESGGRAVLKNIYLYFYPLYVISTDDHWINGDIVYVDSSGYTRADGEKLNFYAIKQKSPISATELEVREAAAYNSARINFTLKGELMMYDNLNVNLGNVDAAPVPFTSPTLEGGAARAGSLHADPEDKILIYDIEVKLFEDGAVKIDADTGNWSIDSGEQPIFTLRGTIND